tara:strand:- start:808 stop:915 length:108 start_codon:yes stop_codon:yes gene_type:complete
METLSLQHFNSQLESLFYGEKFICKLKIHSLGAAT